MSKSMIVKIIELLPDKEAKVLHSHGEEGKASLEFCGCASLGDSVFIHNGFVLYKSTEQEPVNQQDQL